MKLSKANLKRIERGELPEPSEDEVQTVIVDGLRAMGCIVLITTRRVKKCQGCGKINHVGDGVSKGVADLLVRRKDWPAGVYLSLEVKKPGKVKWSSMEQRLLCEVGDVLVVQSLEEAVEAVKALAGVFGA